MYGFLQEYLVEFAYGGVFLVLLLCGLGLPVPEDIPIITSGYLVHLGTMAFWPALTVNLLGIMLGDLIIYGFGYWMGPKAPEHRVLRHVMTPERMKKVHHFFDRHGKKAIFFGRFVAGLRAPLFLAAGITRLPLRIFFGMDLAAALLSVPLLLAAAWYFGDHIDEFRRMVGTGKAIFILALGTVAVWVGGKYLWRKWRSKGSSPTSP
ncbi:MAG: DedA family protein [Nitrospinae bacterium]|nr:DedA family protein [Nitrospinota bacterium]